MGRGLTRILRAFTMTHPPGRAPITMLFPRLTDALYVSHTDVHDPLASHSEHGFELDGAHWPSAEHYYQAMLFDDPALREAIRGTPHPREAEALAQKNKRRFRRDWKALRQTLMTRAVYIKCRTHAQVAQALLATGERALVENSQYDYYWGCGRDGRGENAYGKVLMAVRAKLREAG